MATRNRHLAPTLFAEPEETVGVVALAHGSRAIEDESFPFEALSDVCEIESWRKEINRPLYHIHKWWAHRLGTAFRAIVIGTFAPSVAAVMRLFRFWRNCRPVKAMIRTEPRTTFRLPA